MTERPAIVGLVNEWTSIVCPQCGRVSYHPCDVREGYCGNCHWWTSDPVLGRYAPPQ